MVLSNLDILVISTSFAWLVIRHYTTKRKTPLPPGPKGWPIVGNILQMPRSQEWLTYEKWANEYGPITCIKLPNSYLIVVNTFKAAKEIMDERSSNYSNRPFSAMNKLCELDWIITNCIGEMHKKRRSIVYRYFSGSAALKHRDHQQDEARRFLYNLACSPSNLLGNIKLHATSAILMGAYGFRLKSSKDPLIAEMDRTFEYAHKFPGLASFLLEIFPPLKHYPRWLPFSSFLDQADLIKKVFAIAREKPYYRAKTMIDNGTARPSFVSTSLLDLEAEKTLSSEEVTRREDLILDCAASMYGAGTDSSVASMGTFFLTMLAYPTVFRKAQKEVDGVTGGERLPTFADKGSLPYVEALFLEVLRVNTVTPLGLPHQVVKDDIYRGVFVPGGSTIAVNVWLILRDPEVFPDPHTFNPDRFLGEEGITRKEVLNVIWGFGRRVCPGRQLAEGSLFITMASVIASFDILPNEETPNPVKVSFTSGFIRRPVLVPMTVIPRSKKWEEIIEREAV